MSAITASAKEMLDFKVKILRDTQKWNKPQRIPFNANTFTWMFLDAGYSTAEAARDYDIIEKCVDRFVTNYKVDLIGSVGFRNPFRLTDALGGSNAYTDKSTEKLNVVDKEIFSADDYDKIKDNYHKALWEIALFNKFPAAKNFTPAQFAEASKELLFFSQARDRVSDKCRNIYGIPMPTRALKPGFIFFEFLFNFYRGIKGMSMDIRRCPEKVKDVCMQLDETIVTPIVDNFKNDSDETDMDNPYDIVVPLLGHILLTVKQFEQFYVPSLKRILDVCQEKNKQAYVFAEGSWMRFGEFFNDYKKGVVNMMVELDDPYEIRKKYPNICISGGLKTDIMGKGTPHQCVEMAKHAVNELGRDGGLILMPNKMVSFAYDMRSENLKAVTDFASEYYL